MQDSSWEGPGVAADQTSVGMGVPQRGHIWTDGCFASERIWRHSNALCAFYYECKWNFTSGHTSGGLLSASTHTFGTGLDAHLEECSTPGWVHTSGTMLALQMGAHLCIPGILWGTTLQPEKSLEPSDAHLLSGCPQGHALFTLPLVRGQRRESK